MQECVKMHLSVAICLIASLSLGQVVLGGDVYITYGTAGGSNQVAGVYGGNFKPNAPPSDLNLEQTHITAASYGMIYLKGIVATGLSYDPISKKLLMQLTRNVDISLAKKDPCTDDKLLQSGDFYFTGKYKPNVGPFALYNSDMYFVAQDWEYKDKSVILALTVRKFTGCPGSSSFINRNGNHNSRCSVEVAKILEETIYSDRSLNRGSAKYIARAIRTVGSTLLVVKHQDKLHFLVQVAKPVYRSDEVTAYSLRLYDAAEGTGSKLLYEAPVPVKWTSHIITSIGGISYKDGVLCWSAFGSMFCGKWNVVGSISAVKEVIKPGDAARVCSVSDSDLDGYQNLVTGVAIASAENTISLIFGCWASGAGKGGAGYLTANNDWSNIQMKKISDSKGPIRAGSLAIVDACPSSSRREVETGFDAFL